ncbi:hypothetical protein F4803DRAFT_471204 [Xylaria telfairii]|nr:hypothetical protein F4803DRAFT_471204 [Xylaria telfairii]
MRVCSCAALLQCAALAVPCSQTLIKQELAMTCFWDGAIHVECMLVVIGKTAYPSNRILNYEARRTILLLAWKRRHRLTFGEQRRFACTERTRHRKVSWNPDSGSHRHVGLHIEI